MFPASKYVSFMVRLWWDDQTQSEDCWHSEVEHVQTGERWQFDDLEQSLRFLAQMAERLEPAGTSPPTLSPDVSLLTP
jgi:hypothetical protein